MRCNRLWLVRSSLASAGVVQQLLTTTEWGELDYLVVDFPPGTGDIQLTLCQTVAFSAAVIVTTPQKLAFLDVAKGIRMFARLAVSCTAYLTAHNKNTQQISCLMFAVAMEDEPVEKSWLVC